jgi:aspartyl-tRNA(Asn)/glutamyl-tRNA(Gln) amidotransferase subunit B
MTQHLEEQYKLVLGLEIHMHVKTTNKMFCSCSSTIYDAAPNSHTCPSCLGLPGALPVPNLDAVKKTQLLGCALKCKLNKNSKFDRKHYFYPDLAKGYQISQYKEPLCENGKLELNDGTVINIERIHLEEDTAKSFHESGKTLIDYNKSGMPLIEIVTRPDFRTPEHAVEFSKKIYEIVRTLDVSDADMEKGQLRLEANISMRTLEMEQNDQLPNYKVEVKNINSFRFMEKAVKAEMTRQSALLAAGEQVLQENRGFNEATGKTVLQRSKEDAQDYRYFPEPDIPPMVFDDDYFEELQSFLPQLPQDIQRKLISDYGLSSNVAFELAKFDNKGLYEKFLELIAKGIDGAKAANSLINKPEYRDIPVDELVQILSGVAEELSTEELTTYAQDVIAQNSSAVNNYKTGKENALMFLVGQVMSKSQGKANAAEVKSLLQKLLK